MRTRVVIVGGGLAATHAVNEICRADTDVEVIIVGEETHAPYDRPPLSKQVLRGERDLPSLKDDWTGDGLHTVFGRAAVGLDARARTVQLDDGTALEYDKVLITTGAKARRTAAVAGDSVHTLRTYDDAVALRTDIARTRQLAVVGAGLIGCEVASSATALGASVTVVEMLSAPLVRAIGPVMGERVRAIQAAAGVDVRCGASVTATRGEKDDRELLLGDGSTVPAEVVLLALGVTPATGWLAGSGIDVQDGVICDRHGRASLDGVWAAGDVARWWQPEGEEYVRVEHWTHASHQGRAVARDMLGLSAPGSEVPYFWSDMHGLTLQMLGTAGSTDDVTVLEVGPNGDRLLAVYGRNGRFTAALGVGAPRAVMRLRRLLHSGASYEQAIAESA